MPQLIIPTGISLDEKKQYLLDKMAEIDETKRAIRSSIQEKSNNYFGKKDRQFFVWLRRAKSKVSHLKEEREEIRYLIAQINRQIKQRNKILNSPLHEARAFMAAAHEILDESVIITIEMRAVEIKENERS